MQRSCLVSALAALPLSWTTPVKLGSAERDLVCTVHVRLQVLTPAGLAGLAVVVGEAEAVLELLGELVDDIGDVRLVRQVRDAVERHLDTELDAAVVVDVPVVEQPPLLDVAVLADLVLDGTLGLRRQAGDSLVVADDDRRQRLEAELQHRVLVDTVAAVGGDQLLLDQAEGSDLGRDDQHVF